MSYELADGSLSTDYKIGDKFTSGRGEVFTFLEDDWTSRPKFKDEGGYNFWLYWSDATPFKQKRKECTLAKQIRKTIKQLEKTLKGLEG